MSLTKQVVDIFPTGLNQLPSNRTGGTGRLTDLRNARFRHFDPATPSKPQQLNLAQRNAFISKATAGHNAVTGADITPAWTGPRLLTASSDGSLIASSKSIPRVWDGTDWAVYPDNRVCTNKLTARPWYTQQEVAQATTSSWLNGVTCGVEVSVTQAGNLSDSSITAVVAGFKADNNTWVRAPFVVKSGGAAGNIVLARVENDGTRFWIFVAWSDGGAGKIAVYVYDVNGKELTNDTTHLTLNWGTTFIPGYWDVKRRPGTAEIVLVQPNGDDPEADNNVAYSQMTYNGSAVVFTDSTDTGVHCNGPCAWATNFQDSNMYLLTAGPTESVSSRIWGYKVEQVLTVFAATHEYNFNVATPNNSYVDTLIGYSEASTDSTSTHNNLVCSYGVPAISNSYGAAFDPALRYIKSYRCTWADVSTFLRQTDSVCHVSRAFVIDNDYYAFTYYQSGSGFTLEQAEEVDITVEDKFIGANEQPLEYTGGGTYGSPFSPTLSPNMIFVQPEMTAKAISAAGTPDKVEQVTASGFFGVNDGTPLFKWTFQNATFSATPSGGIMALDGSASIGANTSWDIVYSAGAATVVYTPLTNRQGATIVPGTFTTAGNVSVTGTVQYQIANLPDLIASDVVSLYDNGSVTIAAASNGGNNGTFTILNGRTIVNDIANGSFGRGPGIWVELTSQVFEDPSPATITVQTAQPNVWFFAGTGGGFTDADVNSHLRITEDPIPGNDIDLPISTVTGSTTLEVSSATGIVTEFFSPPKPNATIVLDLATQVQFTFYLQSVDFDSTYIGATISLYNTVHPSSTGLYQIYQIKDIHTVYCIQVSSGGIPRSESLEPDSQGVSIIRPGSTIPQIQPQWFITPLGEVTTAQVGNLEMGLAYADWRREGAATDIGAPNPYPLFVANVDQDNDGLAVNLPFRAVTVTEQSATVIGGLVSTKAIDLAVIGTKRIKIRNVLVTVDAAFGTTCGDLIPGTMAATYDGGRFCEAGILVGLEQPTLYSTQESANPQALTKKTTYFYVACLEAIDAKGNRIWTAPSPALQVVLTGDDNSITIVGRLPIPLGSTGDPVAGNYYGLSNRTRLVLSLYRTCNRSGITTTGHYKITDDLAFNATAPISATNDSGFSFPDQFTWTYKDENLDSVVLSNELLYTDQGQLPRFHPPAFQQGTQGWQERDWLVAYDGAIWFDGARIEGEAPWYTPLFRVPAPFEPTAVANLESFLAGFALDSKWYLPSFSPPVNSAVKIPSWQRLPLEGGSTGIIAQVTGGVAYASNFGGVWRMTRDLRDEWQSQAMIDDLTDLTITSIVVDKKRQVHVLTTADKWFMFDEVAQRWSNWVLPANASGTRLACIVDGQVNASCTAGVYYLDPAAYADVLFGATTGCPLGFDLASLQFGNVSGVKRLYVLQFKGRFKDDHNLTVHISTTDQNATATPVVCTITPDPAKPYVLDLYPGKLEEASSWDVSVDADFTNLSPGNSFELDVIGAEVGVDQRAGINRSTQELEQS